MEFLDGHARPTGGTLTVPIKSEWRSERRLHRRSQPLKWWIFKAFFVNGGFWERRNGNLAAPPLAAGCQAAEPFPGLIRSLQT